MIGLEPTTVAKAGALMAPYLGLAWPRDRDEVLSKINDFRDILYVDPNLTLFNNVMECIAVSTYPLGCVRGECDPCDSSASFQGFTLPEHLIWSPQRGSPSVRSIFTPVGASPISASISRNAANGYPSPRPQLKCLLNARCLPSES